MRDHIFKLFSTNHSPAAQATTLRELLCCLPQVLAPKQLGYQNLFRILIVQFIDAHSFDLRSIKKTCVHIAHPDGKRLIPFDTWPPCKSASSRFTKYSLAFPPPPLRFRYRETPRSSGSRAHRPFTQACQVQESPCAANHCSSQSPPQVLP